LDMRLTLTQLLGPTPEEIAAELGVTLAELEAATPKEVTPDGVAEQLEEAEASLEELAHRFFVVRDLTEREHNAARVGLVAQIEKLRSQFVPETPVIEPVDINTSRKKWAEGDTAARRDIIKSVIEKVVVLPGVRGSRGVDEKRLDIIESLPKTRLTRRPAATY